MGEGAPAREGEERRRPARVVPPRGEGAGRAPVASAMGAGRGGDKLQGAGGARHGPPRAPRWQHGGAELYFRPARPSARPFALVLPFTYTWGPQ